MQLLVGPFLIFSSQFDKLRIMYIIDLDKINLFYILK